MLTQSVSLQSIEAFLAQKRLAIVGISRNPRDFSVSLFAELCRRGYDVIPVNPAASSVHDRRCFARVQDIHPPVNAALLLTPPEVTESVVTDCAAAGIKHLWMYRAAGKGAVSPKAVVFCRERGIDVIPGECPFMFLPSGGIHRLHGLFRKLTGRYPRRSKAA